MAHRRSKRILRIAVTLAVIGLLLAWYHVAANNDYGALSGVYVFERNDERCVLDLRPDRSFTEELSDSRNIRNVEGTWHRYGQSHVSFSQTFLKVSGQELNASGEAHGEFEKRLGIFPILILAPLPDGPRFRKRLLHSHQPESMSAIRMFRQLGFLKPLA
jgi:hypothetical protein